MGGVSREREVSLRTGKAALNALSALGYKATGIDVDAQFLARVSALDIDVAFIALHGAYGEDGRIQALLEWAKIPYTSSGVLTSALCFRKDALKHFLKDYGVPMADGCVYERRTDDDERDLERFVAAREWRYPLIVKPACEGSSIGVARVFAAKDLLPALTEAAHLDRTVLVEAYIAGRELTVSVLNGKALPILEITAEKGFYDYTAKYQSKTTRYEFPSDLTQDVASEINALSEKIYGWIGAKGAIRIDWMLDATANRPVFLEVNTIPGMTETSLLPKAAKQAGLSFASLVERILDAVEI